MPRPPVPWPDPTDPLAPVAVRSAATADAVDPYALGPLRKVYLIWLSGASCEGCTVAASGATHPRLEQLLVGAIPGLPRVELVHSVISVESGSAWVENLRLAERGELDAPYLLTWEGSVFDEHLAGDGFWHAVGEDEATGRPVTSREWLERLAPGAAAVVAIGSCAAWGGIPAATGNPTGAAGVGDVLGPDWVSSAGVPLVRIPGCAPLGDNYTETVAALLLHLNGLAPLPELDASGRPTWLFAETVHSNCPRARYYDEGVFATEHGDATCLVELGCWGPVVQCNIAERGVIDGHGGCMSMGGICIGCTMPGFPDRYAPFYDGPGRPEGTEPTVRRNPGGFARHLRLVRGRHTARRRARVAEAGADWQPAAAPVSRFYRDGPPATPGTTGRW
jgi:hydrogenase small subunit